MNVLFEKIDRDLPVFKINDDPYIVLYTPGLSLRLHSPSGFEKAKFSEFPESIKDPLIRNEVARLFETAGKTKDKWKSFTETPFSPQCLTLHSGSDCNLGCSYCYSRNEDLANQDIRGFHDPESVKSVCRFIAKTLEGKPGPLTVVYHGSGEPTFHWPELVSCHSVISSFFRKKESEVFYYISTNGNLNGIQADWLAKHIDLIGISCDGPASVQQKQRISNKSLPMPVEKLCKRLSEEGGKFEIRVTTTRDTYRQQVEIARYLINELNTKNIRIEPVYLAGDAGFTEEDADDFFRSFSEAQEYARSEGVRLSYAGVRMEEMHSAYCDVLRNNIRLTPDGLSRNCFCNMKKEEDFITGRIDKKSAEYNISARINDFKKKAGIIPDSCHECINVFHCSRGCPDFCIYNLDGDPKTRMNNFRCRLHQLIAVDTIKKAARGYSPASLLKT